MSGKGLQHVRKSLSQYQRLRACLEIKWDTNWERGFLVYVNVRVVKRKKIKYDLQILKVKMTLWRKNSY